MGFNGDWVGEPSETTFKPQLQIKRVGIKEVWLHFFLHCLFFQNIWMRLYCSSGNNWPTENIIVFFEISRKNNQIAHFKWHSHMALPICDSFCLPRAVITCRLVRKVLQKQIHIEQNGLGYGAWDGGCSVGCHTFSCDWVIVREYASLAL